MTLLATASGEFNLVFPSYIKLSLSRHSYPTVLFYFLPSNENLTCSGVIDGEPIRNLLTYLCLSCVISKYYLYSSAVFLVDKSADLCTKPPTRAPSSNPSKKLPSSKSSKKMPGSKSSKMTKVAKMTNVAVSLSGAQFEGLSVPPEVSMPFSF